MTQDHELAGGAARISSGPHKFESPESQGRVTGGAPNELCPRAACSANGETRRMRIESRVNAPMFPRRAAPLSQKRRRRVDDSIGGQSRNGPDIPDPAGLVEKLFGSVTGSSSPTCYIPGLHDLDGFAAFLVARRYLLSKMIWKRVGSRQTASRRRRLHPSRRLDHEEIPRPRPFRFRGATRRRGGGMLVRSISRQFLLQAWLGCTEIGRRSSFLCRVPDRCLSHPTCGKE